MYKIVIYLLLLFGIFLAGLVNHLRWRRRMARIRQHWMNEMKKVRVEYETALDQQDRIFAQQRADFRRRESRLAQKILEYARMLREKLAENEELRKKVDQDAEADP